MIDGRQQTIQSMLLVSNRGVATCTHVRTCVLEKMSKVKKQNETKQNNRYTKQTGN